jgi:hypothetical protein
VGVGAWTHSGLPSGLEIDAYSLVRTDASGNEVSLAGFPERLVGCRVSKSTTGPGGRLPEA